MEPTASGARALWVEVGSPMRISKGGEFFDSLDASIPLYLRPLPSLSR